MAFYFHFHNVIIVHFYNFIQYFILQMYHCECRVCSAMFCYMLKILYLVMIIRKSLLLLQKSYEYSLHILVHSLF